VYVELDLKVMLEGPFNGSGMTTDINSILPSNQPFNTNPLADWYYTGFEFVATMPGNATEWALLEIRDATTASLALPGTMIAKQAVLLLNDGSIVDLDGTSNPNFLLTYSNNLYAVIWTRNHIGVISAAPLVRVGGPFTYDFTTGAAQVLGGSAGHKFLGGGIWGMVSGDANGNGEIGFPDKINIWEYQVGEYGYLESDFSLDGQVDNQDKNDYWFNNMGYNSFIPE
jgi:hypothetical protein